MSFSAHFVSAAIAHGLAGPGRPIAHRANCAGDLPVGQTGQPIDLLLR
jgi:hypothetical protein